MQSDSEPEKKKGKWVFRPWKTLKTGERIYPKPPNKVFKWWEDDDTQADT